MAKISKLIDDITGQTEEDQRLLEQLAFLQEMAKAKSEAFETELKMMLSSDIIRPVEIIGERAFFYCNGQYVNISKNCDQAIADAINDFFQGKDSVKDAFRKLVKRGLSGLIENTSIGKHKEHMFFVYPEITCQCLSFLS